MQRLFEGCGWWRRRFCFRYAYSAQRERVAAICIIGGMGEEVGVISRFVINSMSNRDVQLFRT
jgi:hypothetical protein